MSSMSVVVHPDQQLLAEAAAARLALRILDGQSARGQAHVVLTGGTIGIAMLRALRDAPVRDAVDWSAVHLWWGDERFLPSDDPERNETQAKEALLDSLPLDLAKVHPMPASDGPAGDDVDAAAERYAAELSATAHPGFAVPHFDVVLLGVGPDGHVASLFPESPGVYDERVAIGVRNSPKPPPTRVSLTFGTLNTADEIWLVVAGKDKASVVAMALAAGAGPVQVPAAGVRGSSRTLWLVDREAAGELPASVRALR
jgi:6-phosphogluconolactonase